MSSTSLPIRAVVFDMDGLIIDDVYKQQQKHDLITTFSSLCCFDSDKIMEKVSSLLDDGGVFFGLLADAELDPPVEHAAAMLEAALAELIETAAA